MTAVAVGPVNRRAFAEMALAAAADGDLMPRRVRLALTVARRSYRWTVIRASASAGYRLMPTPEPAGTAG